MEYCARLTKEDGVYLVSFPDFPNVNTYGENQKAALANASEALNACLESDFERGFTLPQPSAHNRKGYHAIQVQPHIEIAYSLRKLRKNRSQVDIARELGISYQAYQKLENPRKCNPTIKTLERISEVLGRRFKVSFA